MRYPVGTQTFSEIREKGKEGTLHKLTPVQKEMTYFIKKTPIGSLRIEITDKKLTGCHWLQEDEAAKESLYQDSEDSEEKLEIEKQLDAYFQGTLTSFSLPISLTGTEFEKSVWHELLRIGYGETVSYKDIAKRIGKPGAVRAVGMACKRNPIGIIVPCHRVVASGGKPGGYNGGIEKKLFLLQLEMSHRLLLN